jgi:hypothetical protein
MATITFDKLKFVERLEKAGASREQASAMAEAFKDASGEAELATKNNLISKMLQQLAKNYFVSVIPAGIAGIQTTRTY